MAQLIIMGHKGDTRTVWEVDDAEAVAEAERILNEHLAHGAAAFAVTEDKTKTPERIRKFDPNAFEILVVPQIAGGMGG